MTTEYLPQIVDAERRARTDHGKPSALAEIVPSGYGYFRPGEVGVVPINALRP